MRLFVAVELPPAAAAAAAGLSQALRERVARLAPRARLTWVAPERMHFTVRFLGEVDRTRADAIAAVLAEPLDTAAFLLTIGQAGVFPPHGRPRAFWLGVDKGRDELQRVEQEVSDRIARAGVPTADQPFSPHLTLARVRDAGGLRSGTALEGVHAPPGTGGMVDAITLFESRLSPTGPTYTALQRTPLHRA